MTPARAAQPTPSGAQGAQGARRRLTLALVVILLLAAPLGALGGYLLGQRTAAGGANAASGGANAASGGATMEAANALYNSGQYGIAAQAYQQLVDQGYGGRALLYNRGIAQLEAGDVAAAVESLRTAQRAFPRDRAIRSALADAERLARMDAPVLSAAPGAALSAEGAPAAPTPIALATAAAESPGRLAQVRLQWLSGSEVALLALLLATLCAGLVLLAQAAPARSGRRRAATAGAVVAAPLLVAALLLLAA